MPKHPLYTDPYASCPPSEANRIVCDISEADFYLLKTIRPSRGTIQTTVNLLVKKLCDELRKRNITTYHERNFFEDFVANCRLEYDGGESYPSTDVSNSGRQPVTITNSQAPESDDGRRVEGTDQKDSGTKDVRPNLPRRIVGRGGKR